MPISDKQLSNLAERVGSGMRLKKCCVVTAESCTGGWIAKTLTDIAGSSRWFGEGYVTYSNEAKRRTLGVPGSLLAAHGAVSQATVRAMALGALERSGAQVAVAVTGIAGPGGAVPGKPVGTVWLCWATRSGRGSRVVTLRKQFRGDRDTVRRKTVQTALLGLLKRKP